MRTIRALAAFTIVTTGAIVAAAGPVAAKGPESVTLTGPGIDGTIVVGAWGAADQNTSTDFPAYLHLALRQLTDDLLFDADATLEILTDSPEPPPGREDLGPKYTLTWTMSGPPDADPAAYTVVQELYPEPSFNRSYIRTLANPYTDSPDKWFVVDPVLADILDAYSASPTAQTVTTPTPPRPRPTSRPPASIPSRPWPPRPPRSPLASPSAPDDGGNGPHEQPPEQTYTHIEHVAAVGHTPADSNEHESTRG